MTDALTSLIEQHKKDIWEWKQKNPFPPKI